jgi:hypothetical protein
LGRLRSRDGEPVFGEPWHAQVLAMADLLVRSGEVSGARWAELLGQEIEKSKSDGANDNLESYFCAVLSTLETILAEIGQVDGLELRERRNAWERAYRQIPHGQPVELRDDST